MVPKGATLPYLTIPRPASGIHLTGKLPAMPRPPAGGGGSDGPQRDPADAARTDGTILLLSSPDPLALQMAELVDDLDEWLTRGDFLPDSWAPSTTHA